MKIRHYHVVAQGAIHICETHKLAEAVARDLTRELRGAVKITRCDEPSCTDRCVRCGEVTDDGESLCPLCLRGTKEGRLCCH